jgi:XTP/dITP diphosphohydrolase
MSQREDKNLQSNHRVIFFATNNINKFNEARIALGKFNVAVGMLRVKSLEIQSESLEDIAKASAEDAFKRCTLPIIVEDAGLFIDTLDGFPGPYAAYVYRTIGNEGILKLMRNVRNRKAHFDSSVAYLSKLERKSICFLGRIDGEITVEERRRNDESGFGFDPIFKPVGSRKTFAQMSIVEKNTFSHRARALDRFAEYYTR